MFDIQQLGRIEYGKAHVLQTELVQKRIDGEIEDTILSLVHDPVVTLGKKFPNVRELQESGKTDWEGYPLFFSERGGEATYHGPGQIVVYPILKLKQKLGPSGFIRILEQALMDCLGNFGVAAFVKPGATGVWVKDESDADRKIASIGIAVRKWVTYHGVALNVCADLKGFSVMSPCGFDSTVMINLNDLLRDRPVELAAVEAVLVESLVDHVKKAREGE